jgi:ATP-binding cassette subfamily F protein uup
MDALNACLGDPECYQERGLAALSQELAEVEKIYEEKSELYLEILELQEELSQ